MITGQNPKAAANKESQGLAQKISDCTVQRKETDFTQCQIFNNVSNFAEDSDSTIQALEDSHSEVLPVDNSKIATWQRRAAAAASDVDRFKS